MIKDNAFRSAGVRICLLIACLLLVDFSGQASQQARGQPEDPARGEAGDAGDLSYVTVNGVKLAYRLEGAGLPVIFVHGESHSHELWNKQIDAFSEGFLFISYDRRGHGQSEAPVSGYSPIAHAEDLNALMSFLGIREAHFVVNSRGGSIIMQVLRLYPQKVRSIVFADATISLAEASS